MQLAKRGHAIHAGQMEIEQDDVGLIALQRCEPGLRRIRRLHVITIASQIQAHVFCQCCFVFDDQNGCVHRFSSATGKISSTVVPCPASLAR